MEKCLVRIYELVSFAVEKITLENVVNLIL